MTSAEEDLLRGLIDMEACRDLVRRYARSLDRCDEALMKSVFHPDAIFQHANHYDGPAIGFCEFACGFLRTLGPQQHIIGQHIVELESDTLAFGESYGWSIHRCTSSQGVRLDNFLGARLLDRYEKRNDVWKIAHRRTVVDWSIDIPTNETFGGGAFGETTMDERYRGQKGSADPSYTWRNGAAIVQPVAIARFANAVDAK